MKLRSAEINEYLDKPIRHPRFNKCLRVIKEAEESTEFGTFGAYVISDSGVGKSMLGDFALALLNKNAGVSEDKRTVITIALKINLLEGATVKELKRNILKELTGEDFSGYTGLKLDELFYKQLKVAGLRVLFIDEFQHLLRGEKKLNKAPAQFIKGLIENHNVAVVLLGTEDGNKIFDIDTGLKTRIRFAGELKAMSCINEGELNYFKSYVSRLIKSSPISMINLATNENLHRLELATGGNLRLIRYLLQTALKNHTTDSPIDEHELDSAYKLIGDTKNPPRTEDGKRILPFTSNIKDVIGTLGYG